MYSLSSPFRGGARDTCPRSKFFQFHAVFLENLANLCIGAPPPRGNPESATASTYIGAGDKSVCEELLDAIYVEPNAKVLCLLDKKQRGHRQRLSKQRNIRCLNLTGLIQVTSSGVGSLAVCRFKFVESLSKV